MKKTVLIFLTLFCVTYLKSQVSDEKKGKSGNYIITQAFESDYIVNWKGDSIPKKLIHQPGWKINIMQYDKENRLYTIQYWKWTEEGLGSSNQLLNNTFYRNITPVNGKQNVALNYFNIKEDDFDKYFEKYYKRWMAVTAGFYSVPFKIRVKNFDFEQDLNIGLSIGFPFRVNKRLEKRWIFEPNFGLGITKINLSDKNSNVDSVRTANALTVSAGLLFRFNEKINIGVFTGYDFLGQSDKNTEWIYNRKLWVGFGINISFNINKPEKEETSGNN
ncbi:MAG: hypothetical protein JKY02_02535 [Flavobacteriaceae bacterium]|nr:hypothetical protein [Flavobacteriaceae bacterium]